MEELAQIAKQLVSENKGLLAADESSGSIKEKLEAIGIEDSVENHRLYRQLFLTTQGIEEFISGVIMYDETLGQKTNDGKPFVELLNEKGIVSGIKVDRGREDFPNHVGEKFTIGIDDLRNRLKEYKAQGAKFTKWRAVYFITEGAPSQAAIKRNAEDLALYAALVQEAGLVPIVEPEVIMDGGHGIDESRKATYEAQKSVFEALSRYKVDLKGILLKPNMVHQGTKSAETHTPEEIAKATIEVLTQTVPPEVPGVVFLSGGQSPKEAQENLRALNIENNLPWQLTFSYGRALQDEALVIWARDMNNISEAQEAFLKAAKNNSLAREGIQNE